jgi:6-phosphogluconolactonase
MILRRNPLVQWDERRLLATPGDHEQTVSFAALHFIAFSIKAITEHGNFVVALSGGSTPKEVFKKLTSQLYRQNIDWPKIHLFWSDERAAPPDSPENNYNMAMQCGLDSVGIPKEQIHRMQAEANIEDNAKKYEELIKKTLGGRPFDLVILGMGEDGHVASLFPGTEALKEKERLIVPNFIPEKNSWRMTMTYPCINSAAGIVIYAFGKSKQQMLHTVLSTPEERPELPATLIGTKERHALWIADDDAAALLPKKES